MNQLTKANHLYTCPPGKVKRCGGLFFCLAAQKKKRGVSHRLGNLHQSERLHQRRPRVATCALPKAVPDPCGQKNHVEQESRASRKMLTWKKVLPMQLRENREVVPQPVPRTQSPTSPCMHHKTFTISSPPHLLVTLPGSSSNSSSFICFM